MTRAEAREELKAEWEEFISGSGLTGHEKEEADKNPDFKKVYEANMMAIKALEDYIAIPISLIKNLCKALSEYEHSDRDCFSEIHDACVDIDAFCRDKLNDLSSEDSNCDSCKTPCIMYEKGMRGCKQELGKWIDRSIPDMAQFMCSRCERRSFFKTNYCPNCGKKMEVEE